MGAAPGEQLLVEPRSAEVPSSLRRRSRVRLGDGRACAACAMAARRGPTELGPLESRAPGSGRARAVEPV